jgi:hypothetical protein
MLGVRIMSGLEFVGQHKAAASRAGLETSVADSVARSPRHAAGRGRVREAADVRLHRYVATSNRAAGSRMPFSRQSGNEETRSERQLPDMPTYNI